MDEFRDLTITGSRADLERLISDIEAKCKNGWKRDITYEEQNRHRAGGDFACFRCERPGRNACRLVLSWQDDKTLRVSNIVRVAMESMDVAEYNEIVEEFYCTYVSGAPNVHSDITDAQVKLAHWISEETEKRLNHFGQVSHGIAHPCDEERWYAFLVSAHRDGGRLPVKRLREWLMNPLGWGEEEAIRLSHKYEGAMSILRYYDEHRASDCE